MYVTILYQIPIFIWIHNLNTYPSNQDLLYHSTSQQIRRRKSTHTQTQLLLLQICIHSCDRDTMVVQCHLHQLNLRYSSGRLFTIVVVCLMIVVLSAPPLLPINLMHQSSSHQSTLMIASTPSPCDSGVIYNQIFNLLPRRPNLVSVLVGYVTWLLYIYFGITKHTTMQKKRVCLSWHVRITL